MGGSGSFHVRGAAACEPSHQRRSGFSRRPVSPTTPTASAPCWQARLSDCDCPTAETRDTLITLAGSSACSCYCDTTPRFEQKRVGRAREGNIGGSSGTGGPSGVIAQTDLSDWATPAILATVATLRRGPLQHPAKGAPAAGNWPDGQAPRGRLAGRAGSAAPPSIRRRT